MDTQDRYVTITTAEDVTDEVIEYAESITDGWYLDTRIDWEDVWDRMDGTPWGDAGQVLDMGGESDTPAMRKIRKVVNARRRES